MQLLRLAAVVLFLLAAVASFGWGIDWTHATILGMVAAGLACFVASGLPIPQPPR